jgi:hypothetical protein
MVCAGIVANVIVCGFKAAVIVTLTGVVAAMAGALPTATDVPTIVICTGPPTVAVDAAVKVNVVPLVELVGAKLAVTPAGRPVAEKLTAPVKPLSAVTDTPSLPLWPCTSDTLLEVACSVKEGAGPDDTTRLTAVAAATCAPAAGVSLITLPGATVELDAMVTVPSTRPAPLIAVAAAASVDPTTLGTVIC